MPDCIFANQLVALAKKFQVKKVFVLQDQTGITTDETTGYRGMFSGLNEGYLTNEEEFLDELCNYVMNEAGCRASPNCEIKCTINTSTLAIPRCRKGMVPCNELDCECDEMYPWPKQSPTCQDGMCARDFYSVNRSVIDGSFCQVTKVFHKSCEVCPKTTIWSPYADKPWSPWTPAPGRDTYGRVEKSTPTDIHNVLRGLSITNLIMVIIVGDNSCSSCNCGLHKSTVDAHNEGH